MLHIMLCAPVAIATADVYSLDVTARKYITFDRRRLNYITGGAFSDNPIQVVVDGGEWW